MSINQLQTDHSQGISYTMHGNFDGYTLLIILESTFCLYLHHTYETGNIIGGNYYKELFPDCNI